MRTHLAADVRPHGDGALRSVFVEFELELQRVEQRVIEAQVVDTLPALLGKVKMSFAVRCGRTQFRPPLLSAVCHSHIWDGSPRWIKNNALDSLSRLKFLNDDKFSRCPR